MAQRYVPNYMQGQAMGWNAPRMYGGGIQWVGGIKGPSFQPAQTTISTQGQGQQNPFQTSGQQEQGIIARSNEERLPATNMTGTRESPPAERKFRYSGMILATIASAIISLGISNIVVTALSVMTSSGDLGCFGTNNPRFNTLGPNSPVMKAFDWSWISSGLWTSILVFIAGNIAGSIRTMDSVLARVFFIMSIISIFILIPMNMILSILDTLLSDGCKDSNPTKFGTPIAIIVLTALEFVVITYIVVRLRREYNTSYLPNDSTVDVLSYRATPGSPRPAPQQPLPALGQPAQPFPSNDMSKQPGIIINLQAPALPQPQPLITPQRQIEVIQPRPYIRLNPPPPNLRWQPRPYGQARNLIGAGRPNMGMFASNLFPSMMPGMNRRYNF